MAGPGRTRDDHLEIGAQLYGLIAEARRISDLAEVVGADALGSDELVYLTFRDRFYTDFVSQRPDERMVTFASAHERPHARGRLCARLD